MWCCSDAVGFTNYAREDTALELDDPGGKEGIYPQASDPAGKQEAKTAALNEISSAPRGSAVYTLWFGPNGHQAYRQELRTDREVVLAAVSNAGQSLEFASKDLQADKQVALAAVTENGLALKFVSDALREKQEIVTVALSNASDAAARLEIFRLLPEQLKADRDIALGLLDCSDPCHPLARETFEELGGVLKGDTKFMRAAVMRSGDALEYASKAVASNSELKAISQAIRNGDALQRLPKKIKNDREVLLAVVAKHASALQHAPKQFQTDREFILAAVQRNGDALRYLKNDLASDAEVVRMAQGRTDN
jgi:hypothetical protein